MLDWIEQHQGAVLLVLSFLVALAGVVLFAMALRLARLLADALRELRRLRIEESRPYVLVDLEFEGPVVSLALRNVGRRPALGVEVAFDRDLVARVEGTEVVSTGDLAIRSRIELIAPGTSFVEFLNASSVDFFRLNEANPRFDGRVEYSDPVGHRYQTPVHLDLGPLKRRRYVVHRTLDDLCAAVEGLRGALERRGEG